jgi:hypothetical protein
MSEGWNGSARGRSDHGPGLPVVAYLLDEEPIGSDDSCMNTQDPGLRAVLVSINLLAAGFAQSVCGSAFLPGELNGADGEVLAMCS